MANRSIPSEFVSDDVLDRMTDTVIASISSETPSVEEIQDLVEYTLFSERLFRTTKAFIIYRETHTRRRDSIDDLMKLYQDMTFASAHDVDMKRENANIDADTAMGTMLKYGSEGSKYFIDRYILPEEIEEAHTAGDIHIHDKDFYMLTETCCQIDLQKLFHDGFPRGTVTCASRRVSTAMRRSRASLFRRIRTRCTAGNQSPIRLCDGARRDQDVPEEGDRYFDGMGFTCRRGARSR